MLRKTLTLCLIAIFVVGITVSAVIQSQSGVMFTTATAVETAEPIFQIKPEPHPVAPATSPLVTPPANE